MKKYIKPDGGWTRDTLPVAAGYYWAEFWRDEEGKNKEVIIVDYLLYESKIFDRWLADILVCGSDETFCQEEFGWFEGPIIYVK